MKLKILTLLLIAMFCLVACQGGVDEQDDDFINIDESIAEEQEELEEDFDDAPEALDDEDEDDADVEEDGTELDQSSDGGIPFIKKVSVFGVEIVATDDISDEQLLHAGAVMAQYLDNDADGVPDNPLITDVMEARNATLTMYVEAKVDEADLEIVDALLGDAQQMLYRSQVLLGGNTPANFDTTLEEVLHLITSHGWAYAYPEVWGEMVGSDAADAMDIARGGRFEEIPDEYPENAWYSYDDPTCDYECMLAEYVYWAYTSLLGAQQYRLDEIEEEWRLGTADLLRETDTAIVELLTDPQFNFGTVLPDGNYTALPIEIEPLEIDDYIDAHDESAN